MDIPTTSGPTASQITTRLENFFNALKSENKSNPPRLRSSSGAIDSVASVVHRNLLSESGGLRQGSKNAESAISLIKAAEISATKIQGNLEKMKELATEVADGAFSEAELKEKNIAYQAYAKEITTLSESTTFNNINLLDGTLSGKHDGTGQTSTGALRIHVGTGNDAAQDYYDIEIADTSASALGLADSNILTKDGANKSLGAIDDSLSSMSQTSKTLLVARTRLEGTVKSNNAQADNFDAAALRMSESGTTDKTKNISMESFLFEATELLITDADITDKTKKQLLQHMIIQSSLFILSEANLLPEEPMQLISNRL